MYWRECASGAAANPSLQASFFATRCGAKGGAVFESEELHHG
jgi:hypothetical protein